MHELVSMSQRASGAALSFIRAAAGRPAPGLIGALLLAAAAVAGCGDPAEAQGGRPQGPPPVSVAPAVQRAVAESEEFSGRLEATELVELRPRVAGAIDKVHFTDGATV
jgi:multidrug efflux system membrane fusion protein